MSNSVATRERVHGPSAFDRRASTIIVDADAHITEPPDIWTSRVPGKYRDAVPQVGTSPRTGHSHWRIDDKWLMPVGELSQAGWRMWPPDTPLEYADCEPASFDAEARLRRMDDFGVWAQVIYPNVIGFYGQLFATMPDGLGVTCVRAYNDFIHEWCSADRHRLIPIAMLPFWDLAAATSEMTRCLDLGFNGVLFANKFEKIGLPAFTDPHWDPIYAAADEAGIPVNYHIGFAAWEDQFTEEKRWARRVHTDRPQLAVNAVQVHMAQCEVLGRLLASGLCDRFPNLQLVSVENAFGQIPFYLEGLDWYWKAFGNARRDLLPSEYFKRQCHSTLWFEQSTLPLLGDFAGNIMFSTDYPHQTSLSPGPCSPMSEDDSPADFVERAYRDLDVVTRRRVLAENAAHLYGVALPSVD